MSEMIKNSFKKFVDPNSDMITTKIICPSLYYCQYFLKFQQTPLINFEVILQKNRQTNRQMHTANYITFLTEVMKCCVISEIGTMLLQFNTNKY